MTCNPQDSANFMVDRFTRGDIGEIAALFDFPAAVYWGDNMVVLKSEDELKKVLGSYWSVLMEQGLDRITARVLTEPDAPASRFTILVSYRFFAKDDHCIGSSKVRYYVYCTGTPHIRMVEYLEWPCEVPALEQLRRASSPDHQDTRAGAVPDWVH